MESQDLHMHTTYSSGDSSVVGEQTVSLIAELRYADVMGISDHFDYLVDGVFEQYELELRSHGLYVGVEVDGSPLVDEALLCNCDYYIYHCRNRKQEYRGLEKLLASEKPVIIAHPFMMGTVIEKTPSEGYLEINNRYIWRHDWRRLLAPWVESRKFVLSSDAHQPNWINQTVARYVSCQLGIKETIIFP